MSIFELSGIGGSIISGVLTDYIYYKKLKNYELKVSKEKSVGKKPESIRIRMVVNMIYVLGLIICLHLYNFFVSKNVSRVFLNQIAAMAGFFSYGSISLLGIIAMEFTPESFSGSSHAIASLAANLGSIFAGIPFGLLSRYYSWNTGFKCVQFLTCLVFLFMIMFRKSESKFELKNSNNTAPKQDVDS